MRTAVKCACGSRRFGVRLQRNEQVGLVTCTEGHHSLLLDSRDYWHDVIQGGKPREVRCRCGARVFEVELAYELVEGSETVRSVEVGLRCSECGQERAGVTFEIGYEPTEELVARPLDPCPEPWLKAKQWDLSALWIQRDVEALVLHVGGDLKLQCYLAASRERPTLLAPREVCERLTDGMTFDLYFSVRALEFPSEVRDCWRRLPVIQLTSPTRMHYRTGAGTLYFLHWADELLVEGQVVPQEALFLDAVARVRAWLHAHFTQARGPRTFDNPSEYDRLKGGW